MEFGGQGGDETVGSGTAGGTGGGGASGGGKGIVQST